MKSIECTAINLTLEDAFLRPNATEPSPETAGEMDDLERPVAQAAAPTAPGVEPEGLYFPVTIMAEDVREYYPRKAPLIGTRIVYRNGAARPVKDLYADVKAKFSSLNN